MARCVVGARPTRAARSWGTQPHEENAAVEKLRTLREAANDGDVPVFYSPHYYEDAEFDVDDALREPSLVTLVEWLHVQHPTFTVELFLRGSDDVRARVLDEDGGLQTDELEDGAVFHSPTVFQLKAMLYHAGILTERGAEPHRLDPTADVWQLREPLDRSSRDRPR